MAYLPPFNGGRINATIAGNTTGAASLVSNGTLTLAGGNNITLSQAGNAITILGGAAGGFSAGMSSLGNTSGSSGLAAGQLVLIGGNNVTLSQSTAASGNSLTISAAAQSNQTLGMYGLGNTTQNSSTTLDARSLSFNGLGAATMGYSNGSIQFSTPVVSSLSASGIISISNNGLTVSIGAPAFSAGLSNLGNTSGTSGTVSNQLIMVGGNNITLSQSTAAGGNTMTISAASQTLQTANIHNVTLSGNTAGVMAQVSSGTMTLVGGNNITLSQAGNMISIVGPAAGGGSVNFSAGTASANLVAVTFGNSNGISFGLNGSTITGSHNALTSQSIQTQNMVLISGSSGNISFNNANNISFGGNASAITASASFNQTVQTQSNVQAISAGTTYAGSGTVSFANSNGVSFGMNGNTLTASAAGGGGAGLALAGGGATYSTGTANLSVVGGAMTIASTVGQSFNFSVPQTSSLSATGGLSISTNGGTISMGVPAYETLSRFEYPEDIFAMLGSNGQGSLSIQHMYVPFYVTGSAMKLGGSLAPATNTSATTASINLSLWMGLYTLNGSTLSLASSGSANNGFQWSQSASTTGNTSVSGMRQMTVPMNINLAPGEYWVAAALSSATTYTSVGFSIYGDNLINAAANGGVLTPIGSNTSAARDVVLFEGIYTAATSAGPTSIVGAQINNTRASYLVSANFYNAIFNATY